MARRTNYTKRKYYKKKKEHLKKRYTKKQIKRKYRRKYRKKLCGGDLDSDLKKRSTAIWIQCDVNENILAVVQDAWETLRKQGIQPASDRNTADIVKEEAALESFWQTGVDISEEDLHTEYKYLKYYMSDIQRVGHDAALHLELLSRKGAGICDQYYGHSSNPRR